MAAVTREIIIQMPLGDMRRKVNRDFVKTIMPHILARYINFPNSRPGFPIAGPNTIKRIVGNIARTAARGGFNVDTNALTLRVCRIVCGMCPTFWHRVLYPTRQHTAGWPDNNDEALVVAIGLKKKALIRLYLNAGATVWHKTPLFGHTWMRVAMYRGIGGIRYLTGFIRPATDSTRKTQKQRMLASSIIDLMLNRRIRAATELLHFYIKHLGAPTKSFAYDAAELSLYYRDQGFPEFYDTMNMARPEPCKKAKLS
jgi:hypothetical protein